MFAIRGVWEEPGVAGTLRDAFDFGWLPALISSAPEGSPSESD